MTEKAPYCPISHSQDPSNPRGTAPTRLPAIPVATDLPSLIRSVNIMRDILRTLTTSLTINNTYLPRAPRPPKIYGDRNYLTSPYPDWYQTGVDNVSGFVGKDKEQRAYVERLNTVVFRNNQRDEDNLLKWNYKVPLTGEGGGNEPFEEDFFERVVKVHWPTDQWYFTQAWHAYMWYEVHGGYPYSTQGCDTEGLMLAGRPVHIPGSISGSWGFKETGPIYHDPNFQVNGTTIFPSGGGANTYGHQPDYPPPHYGWITSSGLSCTFPIRSVLMGPVGCWGNWATGTPTPQLDPHGIYGYQAVGSQSTETGVITCTASTATYKGKPLKFVGAGVGVLDGYYPPEGPYEGSRTYNRTLGTAAVTFSGPKSLLFD